MTMERKYSIQGYGDITALPMDLRIYGASDYATLDPEPGKDPDYTEHGIIGVDSSFEIWFLDWWFQQCTTDKGAAAFIKLARQWKPRKWWHEGGTLDKGIMPFIRKELKRTHTIVSLEALPSMQDKELKVQAFHGLCSMGVVHFPLRRAWADHVIDNLCKFPGGKHDDATDVCGLFGRGIDKMQKPGLPAAPVRDILVPFTERWLTYNQFPDKPKERFFS